MSIIATQPNRLPSHHGFWRTFFEWLEAAALVLLLSAALLVVGVRLVARVIVKIVIWAIGGVS